MNSHLGSKINQLLKKWPRGTVAVLPWLKEQGVYRQLADRYEKSSWLKRIGEGAYIRDGDEISWTGAVYALQAQLKLPVHIGGKTALELKGLGHFVSPEDKSAVYLFTKPATKLPTWFQRYKWQTRIIHKMPALFAEKKELGFSKTQVEGFELIVSSPERAILEVLSLVPLEQSFEEAHLLMEGLTTLRPTMLQNLLEKCNSIKTKRLFMFLAEKTNHQWVNKLKTSDIDLGKGKRVVAKGGVLNTKYQITVPKSLGRDEGSAP